MHEDEADVAQALRDYVDDYSHGMETEGLLESEAGFIAVYPDGTKYLVMVTKIEEGQ